ncbi:MAG: endopeptidase La [Candidatus Sericytochromatia bacterium]|nr:endopeptidase La [Candidatus Tanganyikabacteria bacterium]
MSFRAGRRANRLQGVEEAIPETVPILPVRDMVVFPGVVVAITVGREGSMRAVREASGGSQFLGVVTQRNLEQEAVGPEDLYDIGTVCKVHHVLQLPNESVKVMVQGLERMVPGPYLRTDPYMQAIVTVLPDLADRDSEIEAMMHGITRQLRRYSEVVQGFPEELLTVALNVEDPNKLAYLLAFNLHFKLHERQAVLDASTARDRLKRLSNILEREIDIHELSQKIHAEVAGTVGKTQREYYLREQLRAIQKELGELDEHAADLADLRKAVADAHMSAEALKEAERELARLEKLPAGSPEHPVVRTYLETLAALPWDKATQDELDIGRARHVLDQDHYDIEPIKKRILEYLAVYQLRRERQAEAALRGPLLCFVGPPGVGKTSLGQSIARALGRRFIRMSLGGMRDEAEIRGHRRTYVGAMPGRIIRMLQRAEVRNPVFMLDEIDKVGADFRGDPAAALLEVLDPEQNREFRDHYLDVAFDLSRVLFIATANLLDPVIPALRDRMEVIQLSGYTTEEKIQIARGFLIPRQTRDCGLEPAEVAFSDDALSTIIAGYTREAGVRNLEREINAVCRKRAAEVLTGEAAGGGGAEIDAPKIRGLLGPPRFFPESAERIEVPGIAVGLAWTEHGGDILFIEATSSAGTGQLRLTGHLGEVMKESAQAALSYVASKAEDLGVAPTVFKERDFHVHVPAGAIPKDGPSAGIAIATALASLVTGRKLRERLAMTGEITLRGHILRVGGIKEKVLAARRAGISTVILPRHNEGDLEEVPAELLRDMKVALAETMDQALSQALEAGYTGARKRRGSSS